MLQKAYSIGLHHRWKYGKIVWHPNTTVGLAYIPSYILFTGSYASP